MDKQKDRIYLSTLARAIKRLALAAKNRGLEDALSQIAGEEEASLSSLIDEAEMLASGLHDKCSFDVIPDEMMCCLLERIGHEARATIGCRRRLSH